MEILGKLGINGKILLAQIVNFFLLMYILKRLLYQPLLNIMKEREEKIRAGLKNAEKAEKQLQEASEKAKEQLKKANEEADRILEKAYLEGEEQKADIAREAKEEITRWKEEAKALLNKEKERLSDEVRRETGTLAVQIVKRILGSEITAEDKQKWLNEAREELEKQEV